MGWMLKVGLFVLALFGAAVGAWIIATPILAFLLLQSLLRGKRGKPARSGGVAKRSARSWSKAVGGILILLSLAALFSGGTLSPVVFFVAGMALLLRRRLSVRMAAWFVPIENSILLRCRLNPVRWSAVAEVKVSTRDIEGALSGINERLLLVSSPAPRVFALFTANSFGRGSAEDQLMRRMQSTARALVPLGIYLLPLDSAEASAATTLQSARIETPTEDQREFVSASDYGAAVVEAQHGFVTSFELYTRPDGGLKTASLLSEPTERSQALLTLREFIHEALQKTGAPHPDSYTSFLGSMAATEGETLGQRLTQAKGQKGQVLLVASAGTTQVELSRAQLQAVAKVYG
jgi:hypothetical protein